MVCLAGRIQFQPMADIRFRRCFRSVERGFAGNVLLQSLHETFSVRTIEIVFAISWFNFSFLLKRFDDIFLGIVAYKASVKPLHNDDFHFYKRKYKGALSYKNVLASHGYDNSDEMLEVWREMRVEGYA